MTTECEYCYNQCVQEDYGSHRNNCLRNPANTNYKQSTRLPLKLNQNRGGSKTIVYLPCEICHQPVDLPNWSTHMQSCRERELQRVKSRARSMSPELLTKQLPCDYCQQLCAAKQLHPHEKNCPRNPENVDSAAQLARARPAPSVVLPMRKKQPEDHLASFNDRSTRNHQDVHCQSIDIDSTSAANRLSNNERSNNRVNSNHYPVQRSSSNDYLSQPGKSRRDDHTYENTPIRLNGDRSYENESQPHKYRSPNGSLQRKKSSYGNQRNFNDDRDQDVALREDHTLYHENRKHQHRLSGKNESYEVINNHPDNPSTKKRSKKFRFKRLFVGSESPDSISRPSVSETYLASKSSTYQNNKNEFFVEKRLLSHSSNEYTRAVNEFRNTMTEKLCNEIVQVELVWNERWYKQYQIHRDEFYHRLKNNTEKYLFHGCAETSANNMIKQCFNRSYAGQHGTSYGHGVYFSSKASYSHAYTTPNAKGERCMFLARVLIGKIIVGNSSTKICPAGHDTTTDGSHTVRLT